MRKILLICLLGLNGCIVDKVEYIVSYATQNIFNQNVEVSMYRFGNIEIKYQIIPQEVYAYSMNTSMSGQPQGSVRGSRLSSIDSVQIKFADGKIKTDYIQDIFNPNGKSIFRDEYYITEKSCSGQSKCNLYIYQIDEKDYAEAK